MKMSKKDSHQKTSRAGIGLAKRIQLPIVQQTLCLLPQLLPPKLEGMASHSVACPGSGLNRLRNKPVPWTSGEKGEALRRDYSTCYPNAQDLSCVLIKYLHNLEIFTAEICPVGDA